MTQPDTRNDPPILATLYAFQLENGEWQASSIRTLSDTLAITVRLENGIARADVEVLKMTDDADLGKRMKSTIDLIKQSFALPPEPVAGAAPVTVLEAARDLLDYDAGLLNDFGGGNVGWWQDYIRAEIGRANDYWRALAAQPEPVAGAAPPPWPAGLIHLTNTRRFHVDCATEGCGRRVSTRFEGRDYCEPCGRKVALAQKGDSHE
jgi:hypothetical protein